MTRQYYYTVVGLGLIGSSILKGLRAKSQYSNNYKLIGVTKSKTTLDKAILLGIADEYSTEISAVKEANIVFVCTPINKTLDIIDEVKNLVSDDCIITDVASLKGFIIDMLMDMVLP